MYPFNLRINGAKLLFIGGGNVATRKIKSIMSEEPYITVVSPMISNELTALAEEGKISWLSKKFEKPDLFRDWRMVFACTDDVSVNQAVGMLARELNVWVNVADDPSLSTVHMPAVLRTEKATVAVNSASGDPKYAQEIRNRIKDVLE